MGQLRDLDEFLHISPTFQALLDEEKKVMER